MPSHENRFNREKKRFGITFGQPVQGLEVDYTALDQTPIVKFTSKKYFLEPQGPQYAQSPLPNASFFCIHGDYNAISPGDILLPTRADVSTPRITVLSKAPFTEIVGFRTSRLASIRNGETNLYTNVYFDFCTTVNYPDSQLLRELKGSPPKPTQQVVLFRRDLRTASMDTEGLLFVETDSSPNLTWVIRQESTVGDLMLLTLELSGAE